MTVLPAGLPLLHGGGGARYPNGQDMNVEEYSEDSWHLKGVRRVPGNGLRVSIVMWRRASANLPWNCDGVMGDSENGVTPAYRCLCTVRVPSTADTNSIVEIGTLEMCVVDTSTSSWITLLYGTAGISST